MIVSSATSIFKIMEESPLVEIFHFYLEKGREEFEPGFIQAGIWRSASCSEAEVISSWIIFFPITFHGSTPINQNTALGSRNHHPGARRPCSHHYRKTTSALRSISPASTKTLTTYTGLGIGVRVPVQVWIEYFEFFGFQIHLPRSHSNILWVWIGFE